MSRTPENPNTLAHNSFKLTLGNLPNVTYWCQRINVPGFISAPITQATPRQPIQLPATSWTQSRLNITFQVDEDLTNWLEIYNWASSLYMTNSPSQLPVLLRNNPAVTKNILGGGTSFATVLTTTNKKNMNLEVTYGSVFPVELSDLDLDHTIETLDPVLATASFAYTGITVRRIMDSEILSPQG